MTDNVTQSNVFDAMGSYWAEIADESSTASQIQFIKSTVEKEGWILDLACGTGRHAIPLSKEGYEMVGLDASSNLLHIAKKRWKPIQLVKGDMRYLPFKSSSLSAVLSMDSSFGYLPSEDDDLQSFTEVSRTFKGDGLFLLDVFNQEQLIIKYHKGRQEPPFSCFFKWREYPSFYMLQRRALDGKGQTLCDLWVIFDKKEGRCRVFEHSVRLYNIKTLKFLLDRAGFSIGEVYGSYEMQNFSSISKRLIIIIVRK